MPLDFQSISAIIFLILFALFVLINRKKFHIQNIFFPILYFAMYKTQIGLKSMDSFAKKFPKVLQYVGYLGVVVGFLGMILIAFSLIQNLFNLLTTPNAAAGVALVLPFSVRGAIEVPFFYWIVSIFILAVVHEFSHGIFARLYNLKIKSSGFAFLGILVPVLPAAFVEPDEKQLNKSPRKVQLSVFAAGPFANIVLAFVVLLISLAIANPVNNYLIEDKGVQVTGFVSEEFHVTESGIKEDDILISVDTAFIKTVDEFTEELKDREPGEIVFLGTSENEYPVELSGSPEDPEKGYIGVYVQQERGLKESFARKYGSITGNILIWLVGLLFWLYLLNFGIGLFNLIPLGPIDGGRMLRTALQNYFEEKKADRIWKYVSIFFLFLLIINLGFAFLG